MSLMGTSSILGFTTSENNILDTHLVLTNNVPIKLTQFCYNSGFNRDVLGILLN